MVRNTATSFRHVCRRLRQDYPIYLLMLPCVIYIFLFNYMPMYGVQIAFRDFRPSKGFWNSNWVGLEHFIRFITQPNFLMILRNTMVISFYSITTFPLPIILALMINEIRSPAYKKTVQMITYAPHFISTVVICSMITLFFSRGSGVVNNVIELFGGERIDFLSIPSMFPHIYVWSGVWQGIGWSAILYISALSGVPNDLHEAAVIDGASRLRIIWHINLPYILPTVVITLIMRCGNILSVGFEKVFLLQNSLNLDTSQVISTYVYSIGLLGTQFSYSSAIGLFNTVVNVFMLMLVNAIAKKLSDVGLW